MAREGGSDDSGGPGGQSNGPDANPDTSPDTGGHTYPKFRSGRKYAHLRDLVRELKALGKPWVWKDNPVKREAKIAKARKQAAKIARDRRHQQERIDRLALHTDRLGRGDKEMITEPIQPSPPIQPEHPVPSGPGSTIELTHSNGVVNQSEAREVAKIISLGVVPEAVAQAVLKKAFAVAAVAADGAAPKYVTNADGTQRLDYQGRPIEEIPGRKPDPKGFAAVMGVIMAAARLGMLDQANLLKAQLLMAKQSPTLHLHAHQHVIQPDGRRAAALAGVLAEVRKRRPLSGGDRPASDSDGDSGSGPDASLLR